ncbi:hypothetical protein CLV70_106167 [Pseudosporangium ferrugineum]|uniref:Uncharacterized protein n=1 Tax=Pseudosporangium ferrugineum TaxID=439699 RepID=A0A2T0S7P4_9ACTN|nr:hypothetical protein CLV70_106167 [Pseudosporangium ferrugineum]
MILRSLSGLFASRGAGRPGCPPSSRFGGGGGSENWPPRPSDARAPTGWPATSRATSGRRRNPAWAGKSARSPGPAGCRRTPRSQPEGRRMQGRDTAEMRSRRFACRTWELARPGREHAPLDRDLARRAREHARPSREHARPSREHARPAQDHARPSREHARPAQDHARPSREHARPARRLGGWARPLGGGRQCVAATRGQAGGRGRGGEGLWRLGLSGLWACFSCRCPRRPRRCRVVRPSGIRRSPGGRFSGSASLMWTASGGGRGFMSGMRSRRWLLRLR